MINRRYLAAWCSWAEPAPVCGDDAGRKKYYAGKRGSVFTGLLISMYTLNQ